jgi:hypothetical protein
MVTINEKAAEKLNGNGRLDFEAADVTGQHAAHLRGYPEDATVSDLVRELVDRLGLSRNDPSGLPYTYHARHEREGRHLHASEVVGEALKTGDRITLQPNIDAG